MELKIAENKEEWDSWFLTRGSFEFLQSWGWGEFQQTTGKTVFRFQGVENGQVVCQVQGFTHPIKTSFAYFYAPRATLTRKFLEHIKNFFQKQNILFVRLEPLGESSLPFSYSVKTRQPQNTLVLNISLTPAQLLEKMHSKTRYNIRLAEKKGVEIREEKNIDIFWKLNEQTTNRDGFKSHEKEYYAKMLGYDFVHQLTAYYEEQPIASVLLIVFGKRCVYLHGASSDEYRNIMAPYLLQWCAIRLAQEMKCTQYDFWGIAPIVYTEVDANALSFHGYKWLGNHRFAGVTRFKVGFGGDVQNYPEAREIPLQRIQYQLYRLVKKIIK